MVCEYNSPRSYTPDFPQLNQRMRIYVCPYISPFSSFYASRRAWLGRTVWTATVNYPRTTYVCTTTGRQKKLYLVVRLWRRRQLTLKPIIYVDLHGHRQRSFVHTAAVTIIVLRPIIPHKFCINFFFHPSDYYGYYILLFLFCRGAVFSFC